MHRFFKQNEDQIDNKTITIKSEETLKHMVRSLRMIAGEQCEFIYEGKAYHCEVISLGIETATLEIKEAIETTYESPIDITLFQCLPKGQKLELIVQKNVELGVKAFYLVNSKRCIVDFKHKDVEKKLARYNKIAAEAAKQSKRTVEPQITALIDLNKVQEIIEDLDIMIVLYEDEAQTTLKDVVMNKAFKKIGVMVGPEGGFEPEEIEGLKNIGCKIVTLGKRILRTETAGLAAVTCLQYELGDLS